MSNDKVIPDGFHFFRCCDGEAHCDWLIARSFSDLARRHPIDYYETITRYAPVTQEHYEAITEFLNLL